MPHFHVTTRETVTRTYRVEAPSRDAVFWATEDEKDEEQEWELLEVVDGQEEVDSIKEA